MSKVDELIQKLCPNGVEYRKIGDISYIKTGKCITKENCSQNGKYAIISGGIHPLGYCNIKNREKNTVTIARAGTAGYVNYIDKDFYLNDKCFSIITNEMFIGKINNKYLYYYLKNIENQIMDLKSRGTVPTINIMKVSNIKIALPPIEVQEEIVRILDNFTELSTELSTELKARQKQYEYYRNKLLAFNNPKNSDAINRQDLLLKNVKIKDIFKRVKGTSITAGKMKEIANEDGNIRIFAGGKTMISALEEDIPNANIINIPAVLVQSRGLIDFIYYDKPFTFKNEMWAYTCENKITLKYLYYVLKNNIEYFRGCASCMGSMPQISLPVTEEFKITLPSLKEQQNIVSILDKFEAYTNDLTTGLPAEISLRQKQYEYYRDKLLSFNELK